MTTAELNTTDNVPEARLWVTSARERAATFESLLALASAATQEQAVLAGLSPKGRETDAWFQAVILRVAEALSLVRPHLSDQGFTAEQISGIFGVYATEHRTARELLGKPMKAAIVAASVQAT